MITNIQSHAVPTGICNTLGNKGGIGITLNIGKSSFCFLTAHLAAHQDQIDRRTLDFECISKEIANKLGKKKHAFNQSDSFDDNIIISPSVCGHFALGTSSQTYLKDDVFEIHVFWEKHI